MPVPYCTTAKSFVPLLLPLLMGAIQPRAEAQTTLTINSAKRSDIKGWGVYPSYYNKSNASQNYLDNLRPQVRDAVYALGQSFIRLELSGGYFKSGDANFTVSSITFNTDGEYRPGSWPQDRIDNLVKEINIAKSKGVNNYILSSWSPPDGFKTIDSATNTTAYTLVTPVRYGKAQTSDGLWHRTCLKTSREQAYCNWYTAAIKYLQTKTGLIPQAISLQNEPTMWDINYSGCYWTAAQYYRVAKLMRTTLGANGLTSVVILGHDDTFKCTTSTDPHVSPPAAGIFGWTFPVLDPASTQYDSALASAIGAYGFHTYDIGDQWGTCGGEYNVRSHGGPQRNSWMTEWNDHNFGETGDGGGTGEIDYTIKCFRHFACDFVTFPFNYWCYWTAWTRENGVINGGDLLGSQNDASTGNVSLPLYSKKYWIFQKIFTTVTPGSWISKTVATLDPELKSSQDQYGQYQPNLVSLVAFQKTDATASVLLIANPSANNRTSVLVQGLKGDSATVYQTTATQDLAAVQTGLVNGGSFSIANLPPRAVVLVITKTTGGSQAQTKSGSTS